MIHEEDIIKIRMSQKDASHENTPIDRYYEPMYQKNASPIQKKPNTQKYASHSSWWTDRPFDFVSWAITVRHRQSDMGAERMVYHNMGVEWYRGG